ncbi:MAG: hypothetical protein ACI8X5_002311 [Planctomycetota bacterium]
MAPTEQIEGMEHQFHALYLLASFEFAGPLDDVRDGAAAQGFRVRGLHRVRLTGYLAVDALSLHV